jgi:hypothetical protein
MKKYVLALLMTSAFAHADLLKLTPGSTTKEGVNIATSAVATVNGKDYPLTTVGAGLRTKRVVFDVKVYVAQLMVADKAKFKNTDNGALDSLNDESAVAIRLTFLRDVPAANITESFADGFAANNVSEKDTDISQLLGLVTKGGAIANGGSMTFFVTKNADGTETVAYENLAGTKINGGTLDAAAAGMTHKLFSLWLGNPADAGVAKLKQQLLSGAL